MRSDPAPDLSTLARLALHPGDELRPLLLRVHTQDFASAPGRDPATVAAFEALALGLIPLVTDDVLAETERMLRGVRETPPRVLRALAARLGRDREMGPRRAAEPLVGDRDDRGSREAGYRAASEDERDAMRQDLETRSLPPHGVRERPAERVARHVGVSDAGRLRDAARDALDLPADWRCELDEPAERELFVLALVAAGLSPSDCMRAILGLDAAVSRSVGAVFRLAAIARSTSRDAAAWIVRQDAWDAQDLGRSGDAARATSEPMQPERAGRAVPATARR